MTKREEQAFDRRLEEEFQKATEPNAEKQTKETKMKEMITVNKFKYQAMKVALITLSVAAIIACSYMRGYGDHRTDVGKTATIEQLKTKQ